MRAKPNSASQPSQSAQEAANASPQGSPPAPEVNPLDAALEQVEVINKRGSLHEDEPLPEETTVETSTETSDEEMPEVPIGEVTPESTDEETFDFNPYMDVAKEFAKLGLKTSQDVIEAIDALAKQQQGLPATPVQETPVDEETEIVGTPGLAAYLEERFEEDDPIVDLMLAMDQQLIELKTALNPLKQTAQTLSQAEAQRERKAIEQYIHTEATAAASICAEDFEDIGDPKIPASEKAIMFLKSKAQNAIQSGQNFDLKAEAKLFHDETEAFVNRRISKYVAKKNALNGNAPLEESIDEMSVSTGSIPSARPVSSDDIRHSTIGKVFDRLRNKQNGRSLA